MTTKPHPMTIGRQATVKKVKSLILKENLLTQRFITSKLRISSAINDPTSIYWVAANLSDPKWRYGLSVGNGIHFDLNALARTDELWNIGLLQLTRLNSD
ncbi:hypothetical protein TNCV_1634311 [Trichonephila clavipes]|nr:hypothetical protein TNCV_1634311 [Trichonephila clavipes]